jgi:hypothetical protein
MMLLTSDKHTRHNRKNLNMNRHFTPIFTRSGLIAGVAVAALGLSACGAIAEKVAEEGAERIIEHESGEDVEIDFNGDGGISVQTEDGSVRIGEDGSFEVVGEDGEVFTGQAGEDGFTVEGEDGSAVINIDGDGDNADITFSGDDGDSSYRTGNGVPAEWPAEIPLPQGLADINHSVSNFDGEFTISVNGSSSRTASDYAGQYHAQLESSGYERSFLTDSEGFVSAIFEGSNWSINTTAADAGNGTSTLSVTVLSTAD